MNTKDRILNAAERLFARDGIDAASLRHITTEAGVNLAAVNYHFQSKEALVWAVIARRVKPINDRRLALLDACEAAAQDGYLPVDQVLNAFLRPVVEISRSQAKEFTPIMGRLYSERSDFVAKVYKDHVEPIASRFIRALQRALPDLPPIELLWRLHFCVGALAHTMAAGDLLRALSDGQCDPSDVEGTLQRMEAFLTAGLAAPVMEAQHASQ